MRLVRDLFIRKGYRYRYQLQQLQYVCCSTSSAGDPSKLIDIPKTYNAAAMEPEAVNKWKRMNRRKGDGDERVFRMLLPPPNVTGKLHLGHFLTIAVEDTIARWKLMTGLNVEWIPGFDHAGIATQSVVNRKMSKQKKGEHDVGTNLREFAGSNLETIKKQLEATGALLNWDETYYTLDEKHSAVVKEAFIQLFETGLIRRGDGMVNWSSALRTTVADIEVDNVPFEKRTSIRVPNYDFPIDFGLLYYVSYPVHDSDERIAVATSRPETMFGDVALAVNTEDCRNAPFIGKSVVNPLNGSVIPVVGDPRVKPDFGTGVVKVTPAHDKLDFLIGTSNNLKALNIFTPDGRLNKNCGDYQGLPRFLARKRVIEILNGKNAILDVKSYSGSIGICSRSGDVIEPRLVPHWFLQTEILSSKLVQAINAKSFVIAPDNHARSLVHQLSESQDWCLSRQIQWGHQIPAYYHTEYPTKWVAASDTNSAIRKLEKMLGIEITEEGKVVQDPDVLDTWFSSALIPLAVSDWPHSENFKEITLMETGHDILLFWVWRMAIITLALVDRFPFRHVLLHGIVTDHYGRKMSKSRGNVIDPIHIINGISYEDLLKEAERSFASGELDKEEFSLRKAALKQNHMEGFPVCGTDALRLTLLSQNIFDKEVTLDLKYLDNCRRFTNKLWQALRFLKMHSSSNAQLTVSKPVMDQNTDVSDGSGDELTCKWLLACLYEFNKSCETSLSQAKFHLYAEAVRKFFYQELCDIFIELVKSDTKSGTDISRNILVMQYVFETGVKLAHPIIPFLTEEIWSHLKNDTTSTLLSESFPSSKDLEQFQDPNLILAMSKSIQIIREIRSVKKRSGCPPKSTPQIFVEVDKSLENEIHNLNQCIAKLSGSKITFGKCPAAEKSSYGSFVVDVSGNICRIHVPLMDDSAKAVNHSKIEKLKLKLMKLKQQYDNPTFQQNAPPEAKEKLKKRVETLIIQINEGSPQNSN